MEEFYRSLSSREVLEAGVFWHSYSEVYSWYKMKNTVLKLLKEELPSRSSSIPFEILDVGCGKGTDIFMLNTILGESHNLRFTGVDIGFYAIEFTNMLREKRGDTNCQFNVGNAEQMDFDDESFDCVISSELIEHLSNPEKGLKEMHRVLRGGGAAIITTPNTGNKVVSLVPRRLMKTIAREQEWCFTRHGKLAQKDEERQQFHVSVKSRKMWRQVFKKIGFKVECEIRGSLVYGGPFLDRHKTLYGLILIMDSFLDHLPYLEDFSHNIVIKLRKT